MKNWKVADPSLFWLAGISLLIYANSFLGDFQFDDFSAILENPHLYSWDTFWGHSDHMVRPALYLTLLFDRLLYADSAWGYHVWNVGFHLLSGILVYRMVLRVSTDEASAIAFWSAVLFLVHPLATETVTYLSGRASGQMTCFYLLAFLLYLKGTEEESLEKKPRVWYVAALLAFLVTLASKETAATFPLVILLWDVLVRGLRGAHLRSVFRSFHLPFWVIVLAMGLVLAQHPQYAYLANFSLGIRSIWDNVFSQVHTVAYGLLLFLAPWKQNFDHDLPLVYSLFQWPLLVDLILLGSLFVAALASIRRFPLAAFGIGWFFLQLLPTNSVIPRNDLLSERNLYLPSVGLFIAAVTAGLAFCHWVFRETASMPWVRPVFRSIGLAWVLALCLLTVQRNTLYQDPVLLWADSVQKSPHKARPHNNLGHAYALNGDWVHAIEEFRVALTLNPDYALAQENLRDAYLYHVGRDH